MRHSLAWLACITAGLLCTSAFEDSRRLHAQASNSQAVLGEQLKPLWKTGDRWVIETRSWQVQNRNAKSSQRGPAIQWQFAVQGQDKIDNTDCLRVEIRCLAQGRAQPVTKIWVDPKSMAMRQVQTQLPVAGTFRTVTETYQFQDGQPSPVLAPLTALPIDLPLFLGGQVKGDQSFVYEAFAGPAGAKAPDDVSFAYEVQQEIDVAQPEQVKGLLNEEFAKSLEQKTTVNVRLKTAGRQVRQVWQAGLPWPVFTDNGSTESRLVKVIQNN